MCYLIIEISMAEPCCFYGFIFVFQSLDYDTCENYLLLDEERKKGSQYLIKKRLARWLVFLLIGVITALIACAIDISIEELSVIKYGALSKCKYIEKLLYIQGVANIHYTRISYAKIMLK